MDRVEEEPVDVNEQVIGALCYRGNSVTWWQTKAENYKNALLCAWDAMQEAGFPPDGETPLAEAIRAALALRSQSEQSRPEGDAIR